MEMALKGIPNLTFHQRIRDDDKVDQLHNYVTVYLLIFSGLIIGVKELAGEPLDCWVTLEKWSHFQSHVNYYCWAQNNLYQYPNPKNLSQVPYPLGSEDESAKKDAKVLNSYKWITVFFIVQAILFKLPDIVWLECNSHSGTKMEQLVTMMKESTFKEPHNRRTDLNVLAEFLEMWLKLNGRREDLATGPQGEITWCFEGNRQNRSLSSLYIAVKICYLTNIIMQFVIISLFLEIDFWKYGRHLTSDGDINTNYFPLAALCHFEVKGQSEWVQCILLMNMFMEKIFLVEWFWFLILLSITVVNFISWVPRIFHQGTALRFIRCYLRVLCKELNFHKTGRGSVRHFVCHYLGQDGVFVLRILAINTSSVVMAEFLRCLWNRYQVEQNRSRKCSDKQSPKGNDIEMEEFNEKPVDDATNHIISNVDSDDNINRM